MAEQGNTYHLEPKEDERFFSAKAKKIIEQVLNEKLKGVSYDPAKSADLTEQIARSVRTSIKTRRYPYNPEMRIPRYKLGVQIIFGESKGQGLRIASKCLWDVNYDNWASYTFQNDKMYCTAMVFGTYYE